MKSPLSSYRQIAASTIAGIAMVGAITSTAYAYDFQTLHTFSTSDGVDPSGLTRDALGNLYGGTQSGGTFGKGTIFKIASDGTFTSLYSFQPLEAIYPAGSFIVDASGNITGEAIFGGPFFNPDFPVSGSGVLFHLTSTGTFSSLLNFDYSGGSNPAGGLISDSDGNLYGVNLFGGSVGPGGIYKYSSGGVHTLLHSFNGADGNEPTTALVRDSDGNLYGTTQNGGDTSDSGHSGYGTVWKLSSTNVLTTLHQFHGTDGGQPQGALVRDAAGNLYGTTADGANLDLYTGGGVIYKIDTTGTFSVLHQFTGPDGYSPAGGLVVDAAGNLYGTTKYGGDFNNGDVFRLDTGGQLTVLHSFSDTDPIGAHPQGTLLADAAGNLFGMTVTNSVSVGGIFRVSLFNIDSFAPIMGTVGTNVILTGRYFTGTTSVKFNGVSAAFTVDSDTQITATVPNGAVTGKITIAKAGATTTSATTFGFPAAPSVTATPVSATSVHLIWKAATGATGYTVYRSTTSGVQGALIGSVPFGTRFNDTGLTPSTTYYYVVTADNPNGSTPSTQISATTFALPSAPSLTATGVSPTEIHLIWTATSNTVDYSVYRSTTPGTVGVFLGKTTGYRFNDSGLTPGTTYYYIVVASNAYGYTPSAQVSVLTLNLPSAPSLTATGVSATEAHLIWTATSDTVDYSVFRSTTPGTVGTFLGKTTAYRFNDSGLTSGTTYYYTVLAGNAYGYTYSNQATAVTQ